MLLIMLAVLMSLESHIHLYISAFLKINSVASFQQFFGRQLHAFLLLLEENVFYVLRCLCAR